MKHIFILEIPLHEDVSELGPFFVDARAHLRHENWKPEGSGSPYSGVQKMASVRRQIHTRTCSGKARPKIALDAKSGSTQVGLQDVKVGNCGSQLLGT